MKRISYLETCHPRNLLSGIRAFVLRLDSRLRGNDSEVVSLHASRFTRCVCFIVLLFSLHASHFTFHAQAALENGMEAAVVVGQPDFNTGQAGTSSRKLGVNDHPVAVAGGKLIIGDRGNSRVLIFNSIPNKNYAAADVVLGQTDFESSTGGLTQFRFQVTTGLSSDGKRLAIADRTNHRILIWNSIPTVNFTPADVVVGQPNFTSNGINQGGAPAANTLSAPEKVFLDGQRMFIADRGNNRVLIWNSVPTQNNSSADVVVGQPNFVSVAAVTTRTGVNNPFGVFSDQKRLMIADRLNHRILIYNRIPTTNNAAPDIVLGQSDFISSGNGLSAKKFSNPVEVFFDGQRLYVADQNNHRIMIWDELPQVNDVAADFVLGQLNFSTNVTAIQRNRLDFPANLVVAGGKLIVGGAGTANNRVLIFNLSGKNAIELGPQFSQGKAVVGKVFWDFDGDGRQDHFGTPSQELRRARPATQARRQDA